MRPLIGVFTAERHPGDLGTLQGCDAGAAADQLRLGTTYLRAIEAAGGLPVVLAPHDPELADALVARLDGLCLAGGPDLDPLSYCVPERHPALDGTDRAVDGAEQALARAADRLGLPLLGICRGAQALNVARGGTLHQHVDGHRQTGPAPLATHPVAVTAGSTLAWATGGAAMDVNSFHHQAVNRLGGGLQVVATAPDGTVEAIEDPSRPFVLGVQWHAEAMVERAEQLALFRGLVAAAAAPRLALAARHACDRVATVRGSCPTCWTSSRRSSFWRWSRPSTNATSSSPGVGRPSAGIRTSRHPASSSSTSGT